MKLWLDEIWNLSKVEEWWSVIDYAQAMIVLSRFHFIHNGGD